MENEIKYKAGDGTPCSSEECKLIDSLKRLAKKWKAFGNDLMLFSFAGSLYVVKKSCIDDRNFYNGAVEFISGIANDGGDPDAM